MNIAMTLAVLILIKYHLINNEDRDKDLLAEFGAKRLNKEALTTIEAVRLLLTWLRIIIRFALP